MNVVSLVLAAAAVVAAPDPKRPDPHQSYQTVTVAPGVVAFIAPEGRTGTVQGNSVAVIGSAGVLVVDTGQFADLTRRMIADIKKLTDQPVRFVVNTHWHGDHLLGNYQYKAAFPGVVIVNHKETLRLADKTYTTFADRARKEFPPYAADLRAAVARGTRKSGATLTDHEKDAFARQADDIDVFMRQLADMPYVPADLAFEKSLEVSLGSRKVQILHLGRGNTAGDTVVFVPDAKVAMAGDMVVYPSPYSFGSWLSEWPTTLRALEALGATRTIPGHGPVLEDNAYVETVIALIEETRRQVAAAVKDGLSLEDTRKKVDLKAFRESLAGTDAWRQEGFDEFFLQPAVERAYKEAKGEPMDEGRETS
jgi:glyoxylase-like metal-dependent hydrolase (beta-lactamase superfamily II)